MTFLDIIRRVAERSGTADPRSISSALGATGRIGTIANLVQDAWTQIQTRFGPWRFLVADLPDTAILTAGVRAHTRQALLGESAGMWADWVPGGDVGTVPLSVWPADPEDRVRERPLTVVDHRGYRQTYETGNYAANPVRQQPTLVAVDPHDRLVVWPVPDVDYRIRGTYRRQPQTFLADSEEPIVLPQHHQTLVSAGVLWLHRHDESPANAQITAQGDFDSDMQDLRRRYLWGTRVAVGAATIGPTGANPARGSGSILFPDVDFTVGIANLAR